jgi:hypothetical protein
MPKAAATVSEAEHYKMVDATLATLLNTVPVVPKQTLASRASAYWKMQKVNRPTLTYKEALAEVKRAE